MSITGLKGANLQTEIYMKRLILIFVLVLMAFITSYAFERGDNENVPDRETKWGQPLTT